MLDANGCAFDYLYIQSNALSSEYKAASPYTNPALRERIKNRIMAGSDGGRPGQWSARKAQLLAARYRAAGGGYKKGSKPTKAQRSLRRWTREKWRTSDGKPALRDGRMRRYLPDKVWGRLTPAQRRATNAKKIRGDRAGRQFVANTEVAARRSRAVRMRSKVLGRPIGGMAEFDGDNDGFVTGPTGVDNIPAPRVVRTVTGSLIGSGPFAEPQPPVGGLPDSTKRPQGMIRLGFDPAKFQAAFQRRQKALLDRYVPDRKSEDLSEFGDVLMERMGIAKPTNLETGEERALTVDQMVDEGLSAFFGSRRQRGLVYETQDLLDQMLVKERTILQVAVAAGDSTQMKRAETRVMRMERLRDQLTNLIGLWNLPPTDPRHGIVREILKQRMKDSFLKSLVAIGDQLMQRPEMRGKFALTVAQNIPSTFEAPDADGWNRRAYRADGTIQNLIVLSPSAMLMGEGVNFDDQKAGDLERGTVSIVGAGGRAFHLGSHEFIHARHTAEMYASLGIDVGSDIPVLEQIKQGGTRVGDTQAGMMFALRTGISPYTEWDVLERRWRSGMVRQTEFGVFEDMPFAKFVGLTVDLFLNDEPERMVNPHPSAPQVEKPQFALAAAMLRNIGFTGFIKPMYDQWSLDLNKDFPKLPPQYQVSTVLAIAMEALAKPGHYGKPVEDALVRALEQMGLNPSGSATTLTEVLDEVLSPALGGRSLTEFLEDGVRLFAAEYGHLPTAHAIKGMPPAAGVGLGSASGYARSDIFEAVAEAGNLLAMMDMVTGMKDGVKYFRDEDKRMIEVMRRSVDRVLPKRGAGTPVDVVQLGEEVRAWHELFRRMPRIVLDAIMANTNP